MDIFLLIVSAVLIARFIEKRSKAIALAHTVLFAVLLFFMCFTTEFTLIQTLMRRVVGPSSYSLLHDALLAPCAWIYSASFVIYLVEALFFLIVVIGTAIHVAGKLLSKKRPFEQRPQTDRKFTCALCDAVSAFSRRIWLKYCRLLN